MDGTWRETPALTLSEAKKYFTAMTVPSSRRLDLHQEDVTHWLNIVLNILTAIFKKPPVPCKVDFGYSTSRKLVVEEVVNSGQKMAEEALFPVK